MCVTFVALFDDKTLAGGKYRLILVNNRDEEFDRKTSLLRWEGDILAGRDEGSKERGTWLGINRRGDIGNLLSITEPAAVKSARGTMPSRGKFVIDFLENDKLDVNKYCNSLASVGDQYHGFQFVGFKRLYDGNYEVSSVTNRIVPAAVVERWPPGIYGFGNSPTTKPFRKVVFGQKRFSELVNSFDFARSEDELIDELLNVVMDPNCHFPDEQLRFQTGLPNQYYKPLCSLFVRYAPETKVRYGTRSHSIILVEKNGTVTFNEAQMATFPTDSSEANWEKTVERFKI